MRKVCIVVTARTSYTKIRPILKAVDAHPDLDLQIVCAASALLDRYGDTINDIKREGFTVHGEVAMIMEGESLLTSVKSTGVGTMEFASVFDRLSPDVVLVMADRFEIMSAAIAASYLNIPLAHVQGGEVSGNIDEKVRHAVTKLSDIHFPATSRAADWIHRMGEQQDRIFTTGCPSTDVCEDVVQNPEFRMDMYDRYGGVGSFPSFDEDYVVVLQHPVTTEYGHAADQADETLYALKDIPANVFWFWPNVDAGSDLTAKAIRRFREHQHPTNMHFFKNMEPDDFLRLVYKSKGMVGNSSTGIRECSFLGVPAVNIGSRQSNRERGPNVTDVGYDRTEIFNAVSKHLSNGHAERSKLYGCGAVGPKIADVLATVELSSRKVISYAEESTTKKSAQAA